MKRGVTLIEIMIYISLFATLTVGSVNVYQSSDRRQAVNSAAIELKQAFQTAKAGIQNGRKDCSACGSTSSTCGKDGDTPLNRWSVTVTYDSTKLAWYYTLKGYCSPGGTTTAFYTSGNMYMSKLVTLSGAASGTEVNFYPGGEVGNPKTITITSGSMTRSVSVNAKGEVEQT